MVLITVSQALTPERWVGSAHPSPRDCHRMEREGGWWQWYGGWGVVSVLYRALPGMFTHPSHGSSLCIQCITFESIAPAGMQSRKDAGRRQGETQVVVSSGAWRVTPAETETWARCWRSKEWRAPAPHRCPHAFPEKAG